MKVNIRDSQIGLWQELADLIGAKHPADAVSYVGARYLPALIAKLKDESLSFPTAPVSVSAKTLQTLSNPTRSASEPKQPVSDFDDLFDSINP